MNGKLIGGTSKYKIAGNIVTYYSVALTFRNKRDKDKMATASHLEIIAGENPLTSREVLNRAEAFVRCNWDDYFSSLKGENDDYELWLNHMVFNVNHVTQG